jgi:hypothetical protein
VTLQGTTTTARAIDRARPSRMLWQLSDLGGCSVETKVGSSARLPLGRVNQPPKRPCYPTLVDPGTRGHRKTRRPRRTGGCRQALSGSLIAIKRSRAVARDSWKWEVGAAIAAVLDYCLMYIVSPIRRRSSVEGVASYACPWPSPVHGSRTANMAIVVFQRRIPNWNGILGAVFARIFCRAFGGLTGS